MNHRSPHHHENSPNVQFSRNDKSNFFLGHQIPSGRGGTPLEQQLPGRCVVFYWTKKFPEDVKDKKTQKLLDNTDL